MAPGNLTANFWNKPGNKTGCGFLFLGRKRLPGILILQVYIHKTTEIGPKARVDYFSCIFHGCEPIPIYAGLVEIKTNKPVSPVKFVIALSIPVSEVIPGINQGRQQQK